MLMTMKRMEVGEDEKGSLDERGKLDRRRRSGCLDEKGRSVFCGSPYSWYSSSRVVMLLTWLDTSTHSRRRLA